MIKTVYVTVEALIKLFNEDYGMRLPKNTRFILTSEINKEKEQSYIADLQSQLVEKEKEIEKVLKENERLCVKYNVYTYGDKIERDKIYAVSGEALEFLINNQNKKAIEQLEKVKSAFGLINSKLDKVETIKEYIHYIDHQINELKGKVE